MFQSPRGDFGFLKSPTCFGEITSYAIVSIPSRGFWFFEANPAFRLAVSTPLRVSIPSRGFWFFEAKPAFLVRKKVKDGFQSPRGDFGFLKGG